MKKEDFKNILWCWGQKVFWPLWYTDFSALCALEILKTFEIHSFFCEKWLLSHVLRVPKSYFVMQAWQIWPFDPCIILLEYKYNDKNDIPCYNKKANLKTRRKEITQMKQIDTAIIFAYAKSERYSKALEEKQGFHFACTFKRKRKKKIAVTVWVMW